MHQIDHKPHITTLYHNQPFPTSPLRTTEQTSASLPTATPTDERKELEPVVLHTHISKNQTSNIQYVMKTTLSLISFHITNPTSISLQFDPFLIQLKAPCRKKRTDTKQHRKKYFLLKGLQILQQSKAYFYFRPSLKYRDIFIEGPVRFRTNIPLRLTKTARCQSVHIHKGTHLGSLQPVLLSKYLKATDTLHRQHS